MKLKHTKTVFMIMKEELFGC